MLYLSNSQILEFLDMNLALNAVKSAFLSPFVLGGGGSHGMRLAYEKDKKERIFIAMPCYLGGEFDITGAKWHGPMLKVKGASRDSNYMLMLNDANSGVPLALMGANAITEYRTAATSLLACLVLAPKEPKTLAIIGPGKINTLLAKGILKHFKSIEKIYIKGRSQSGIEAFISATKKPNLEFSICTNGDEAAQNADIISINTGFAFDDVKDMPLIKHPKEGCLFLCSAFAYFSDKIIINAQNVVDYLPMYECYEKELGVPTYKALSCIGNKFIDLRREGKISKILNLSEFLKGKAKADENKIKIFSSGGLAFEDLALGFEIYKKAKEQNIGVELEYD